MYSGTNNGFMIRDANEAAASAIDQVMDPCEVVATRPELVVTFL